MRPEEKHEFYIGYLDKAPSGFAKRSKTALIVFVLFGIIAAVVFSMYQRPFNDGNFEFGELSQVTGVITTTPVPRLIINSGSDPRSVLLVGAGKAGALGTIDAIEYKMGDVILGMSVTVQGTLIYGEGKSLMELTAHENSVVDLQQIKRSVDPPKMVERGVELQGEIIDPKCYFGVMKPGEGRTHGACAVRCVSGGIPPVLKVERDSGPPQFYLIQGENGERINSLLLDHISTRITIQGDHLRADDWDVLYADVSTIQRS